MGSREAGLAGTLRRSVDIEQIEHDCQKALRAWHVAWMARVNWHREHFFPLEDREQSLVYESVLDERQKLRDAEERAYDRFLQARDVLAEAMRSDQARGGQSP